MIRISETFDNGVALGNPPGNLKIFRRDHIDWKEGVTPRDVEFPIQTKITGAGLGDAYARSSSH